MTGFVYAIADGHGRVKLGWSADPKRRFVKAQADNGADCELLGVVKATREQEGELHTLLEPWRLRGEWFDKSAPPVAHFISFIRPVNNERRPTSAELASMHPLKRWRKKNRLTAAEAAEKFWTTQSSVSRIENGVQKPSFALISRILEATGGAVTPNDFLPPFRGDESAPCIVGPEAPAQESAPAEEVTGAAP